MRKLEPMCKIAASRPIRIVAAGTMLALGGLQMTEPRNAAAAGGDPAKGEDLAKRVCTGCHGQTSKRPPSLAQIASTPHYSLQRLRRILSLPPHKAMPGFPLKPEEVDDIAAYIRSLGKAKQ